MSATLNAFGLRPIYHPSGRVRARAFQNGIVSAYNTNLYQYTPVALVTSTYNTWQLAVAGANDFGGVFYGVEYTDANGRRQYSKMWPANLAPLAGTNWTVWVVDDPLTIYEIQANGALGEAAGRGLAGQQVNLLAGTGAAGIGAGSTVTQLSAAGADASSITPSAQGQLRILEKARYVDNDWGDAFPVLQVQIARHQYLANKVAV